MGSQKEIDRLAEQLVQAASSLGLTISTAESCTAGLVASSIADVPGSSAVLRGGAVTYCDQIKRKVLGVRDRTLSTHTAVSAPTACEMADGARTLFESDLAVSLTGYAGPGGGTDEDPVGTVYLGLSGGGETHAERFVFAGPRNEVRAQAACTALTLLLEQVESRRRLLA